MLTRRIVASACALCLAIPAAASASPATDPPNLVKAEGPFGMTLATDPPNLVKAKGPYGMTTTVPQATTSTTPHASASNHDATGNWRTAAISEAALLAALALGSALVLTPRRRAPRLGT